jgi:predicted enzyme related to lactoylglutathione lyase
MSLYDSHPAGNFCWVELGTNDVAGAKSFYSQIFGWDYQDVPADNTPYTLAKLQGRDAAGMYTLGPDKLTQGVPPHWLSYVCVQSAEETTKKAVGLGGKALMDPFDVMDIGRMTVLRDPQGAVLAMWQPVKHHGVGILGVHGTMTWCELYTTDPAAAKSFYTGAFGWTTSGMPMPDGEYTLFVNGEKPVGGTVKIGPELKDVPPNWLLYFHVDDCDGTVGKALGLGARLKMPPMDVPNVGRMCVLADPQGAVFAVIKLSR